MEFNAEFRSPDKAWLLIFDGDKDRSLHVTYQDVLELIRRAEWLKGKFEASTEREK